MNFLALAAAICHDPYSDEPDLTPEDREAIRNHLETELELMDAEDTTTWNSKYVDEL